jgi:hypothetical protein
MWRESVAAPTRSHKLRSKWVNFQLQRWFLSTCILECHITGKAPAGSAGEISLIHIRQVQLPVNISKIYFGHGEPLGVSESCRTRIPGWPNPGVYWTDAVAFRCIPEHLGALATCQGVLTTSLGAPGSVSDKPSSADQKPGSADDKPGNTSNHGWAVWETHLLWGHWCCAWQS